jgi:hypothetical protein
MSKLEKFNTTLEDFDKEVEKLKGFSSVFDKLQGLIVAYKDISNQFEENSKSLINVTDIINSHFDGIRLENKALEKNIIVLLEKIQKENKDFYKDLDSSMRIKLDENKSQIKQLIENERIQIKQIFEIEFAKNTKDLRQVIENETKKQTQLLLDNQKTIKISLWVIGGFLLFLNLIMLFKLTHFI